MESEKSEEVKRRIDEQRNEYLRKKRETGYEKPKSDFMKYYDAKVSKIKRHYPHLSPAQLTSKICDFYDEEKKR